MAWANGTIDDIATALTNSIAANGETPITANLPMGTYRHTGVGNAVARTDYASAAQIQDNSLQVGGTVGGTADALTLTPSPAITAYATNQRFLFTSGASPNATTTPTLAVSGLTAKTFKRKDGTAIVAGDIPASTICEAVYNGTNMILLDGGIAAQLNTVNVFTQAQSAPTPAQFDNSTKLATTAGVKAAGIQAANIATVTTSAAVALSSVGGTVLLSSASAIAPTLPAANTVPAGGRIEFMNINAGVATVTRTSTDTIAVNAGTVTSMALGAGDTLTLESNGSNGWNAVGGSAQLGSAAVFGASKSSSGYQKLPGGLILQWGQFTQTDNGAAVGFTFTHAIAFPTTALQGIVGVGDNLTSDIQASVEGLGTTTSSGFTWGPAASRIYRILVVGY